MTLRDAVFPNLRIVDHPLIGDKLTRARDRTTSTPDFRRLLREIAALMAYEIFADLPTRTTAIETPLEPATGPRLATAVSLVPIMRAGIGMTDGIRDLVPEAHVGHIGLYRDETSLEPVVYYKKLPSTVADGPTLLVDPMLATGGSAVEAARILVDNGCTNLRLVCLVAAPEGVAEMAEHHPDVLVYTAALDDRLDERGYIRPGLGDAGDRIFGTH